MSLRLWVLRLAGPFVGRAPVVFYPVAAAAGWLAWNTEYARRRRLTRNMLPLCDGDSRRARREGRQAYINVARYWVDLASLPYRRMETFERDHLAIVNAERMVALDEPGPVVAVSAHTGNAELVVQALTFRNRGFVALVEALEPPALADHLLRLRSAAGSRFYEADFAGLRAVVAALKAGDVLGVMGDRDIQEHGVLVTLAGRRVKLPRGPWELARRTNALVVPMFTARGWRDDFTMWVGEPYRVARTADEDADVAEAAARYAVELEAHLRRDPGQWTVLEDFWKVHGCGQG